MSEASRARVTITLGRTGQAVKRPESDFGFSESLPVAGSKRSIRDRIGGPLDSWPVDNKRQRGDCNVSSLGTNGVDDVRIGKNDLRLKLMQKNMVRQAQSDSKFMDLREKLSRMGQPPQSSLGTQQRMPDSKETSILGRIPVTRSTNDVPQMKSSRGSYSAWTLDHIRQRSPERIVGPSRGRSPERIMGSSRVLSPERIVGPSRDLSPCRNVDFQRRPLCRTVDDVRAVPYLSKDVHIAPRPMSASPYMTNSALPPGSLKPVPPGPPLLGQLPPPTGIAQRSLYTGEEQQTVDTLLHSLGLGKYAIMFKSEEVDMTALKQMGENDLKELGVPMGPRKKILLALLPRTKRQP